MSEISSQLNSLQREYVALQERYTARLEVLEKERIQLQERINYLTDKQLPLSAPIPFDTPQPVSKYLNN